MFRWHTWSVFVLLQRLHVTSIHALQTCLNHLRLVFTNIARVIFTVLLGIPNQHVPLTNHVRKRRSIHGAD